MRSVTPRLGASLLALSIALASVSARAQEPRLGDRETFDAPLRLDTLGSGDLRDSDLPLRDPLIPDADPGNTSPATPASPSPPVEPESRETEDDDLDFDLFEGADAPRSVRQNLPSDAAEEAQGPDALPAAELTGVAPGRTATTLPALGLVRLPSFSPAAASERVNIASGLRPSLPIGVDDPFAPLGIRAGRFVLFPTLEQEIGWSDNLDAAPEGASGAFSETRLTTRLQSDWSRHALQATATAGYRRNFGGETREEPRFGFDGLLRLDIDRDLTANLRASASFAREDPILLDPLLPPSERPDVLSYAFGADVERAVARAQFSVRGEMVREERESVIEGAETNDFTTATLGLRAGYDIAPAWQPFVAASLGRRMFDERAVDGITRDSLIPALRAGIAFDSGEKLSGELAIGYALNVPSDDTLDTLGAATVDMALNWSPRRGTDVVLTGTTFFDPDSSNLSTSTVYETALGLRHRLTSRLSANGRITAALRDREGPDAVDDTTYGVEIGLEHWINRSMALTALARHERLESDIAAADYSASSVRVGLRLQR